MKNYLSFLIAVCFIACNEPARNVVDKGIADRAPEIQLSPLQLAVHAALIPIVTKDIESTGNIVKTIQIDGMEILTISKKEYYSIEMKKQETDFKSYLEHISKLSKKGSSPNNPINLRESQARHNAVMAYLESAIKTASSKPEIYKVVYYLNAHTSNLKYDQWQTTFLDVNFKKIVSDYSFLEISI